VNPNSCYKQYIRRVWEMNSQSSNKILNTKQDHNLICSFIILNWQYLYLTTSLMLNDSVPGQY